MKKTLLLIVKISGLLIALLGFCVLILASIPSFGFGGFYGVLYTIIQLYIVDFMIIFGLCLFFIFGKYLDLEKRNFFDHPVFSKIFKITNG